MSKLSELLNPTPAPGSETSPVVAQPPVQPLVLDGQHHRTSSVSYTSPTHTRHPSITSPGLEALANLASNTAPILSPTQHTTSFAQSTPYQPSYSRYNSRPSSSHTTLPPLVNDFTHASTHHSASHSTDLEQYHHHSGGERRLSNVTDPTARLPPLQHSPTDQLPAFPPNAPQPRDAVADYPNATLHEQLVEATLGTSEIEQDPYQIAGASATSQIRQPSPVPGQSHPSTVIPESQSEQVEVKAELSESQATMPGAGHLQNGWAIEDSGNPLKNMGSPAPKSVADIKKTPPSVNENLAPSSKPKGPPSKKRAAPKKGTASAVRPAAKKRKLDSESIGGTPPAQRLGTPSTRRPSNTPAPKNRKQGSVTPARSSSVAYGPEEEDGSEEDGEAYCICRKPDDHTLMIGCDGPCEDWFHVRCVSMDSVKAKLIFKWYCPNCAETGLETLWKRMCRLEGCQEPARQDGDHKSKYCCDEHGAEFMKNRIADQHSNKKGGDRVGKNKQRRRENYTDNHGNTEEPVDDEPNHLRGGVLRASELKALTDEAKDLDSFRRLGEGVLSPPPTASPEGDDVKMEDAADMKPKVTYTPEETVKLEDIITRRDTVRAHKRMLDDRDRFLLLVTARAKTVLAEMKEQDKSVNTICGYDWRISWSDDEFNEWRASPEGKSALEKGGILSAPVTIEKQEKPNNSEKPAPEVNGHGINKANENEEEEIGKGVCKKKRCERHKAWLKLMQQDILFETHQARQSMKKLEAEEKGLKDRAMIRSLEVAEI